MDAAMSPHRYKHRGTFVIDREIGRVGRIHLASGTRDLALFRRMNDMLTTLKETARWDLLRALRDRVFSPLELWAAFRDSRLDLLPTSDEMLPATTMIDRWLPRLDVTERHRDSCEHVLTTLLALDVNATARDLPAMLKRYRDECQDSGHRRTFNMTRSALQAFMRDCFGGAHRLWSAVADVAKLKETPRQGNPQSLDQLGKLAKALAPHGAVVWSLALTGMRRGEYWSSDNVSKGNWDVSGDRILVRGTKTAGANRFIPLVLPPALPTIGYWGFTQLLREVTDGAVTVHDFRKTYANIMEAAAILKTRRRLYLGHGNQDVTDLYELHEVKDFLAADAEKLRTFIGEAPKKALEVMA